MPAPTYDVFATSPVLVSFSRMRPLSRRPKPPRGLQTIQLRLKMYTFRAGLFSPGTQAIRGKLVSHCAGRLSGGLACGSWPDGGDTLYTGNKTSRVKRKFFAAMRSLADLYCSDFHSQANSTTQNDRERNKCHTLIN
jgi:hypothetical protein